MSLLVVGSVLALFAVGSVATNNFSLGLIGAYAFLGYMAMKTESPEVTGMFVLITVIAALSVASVASGLIMGRSVGGD